VSDEFAKSVAAAVLRAIDRDQEAAREEVHRIVADVRPLLEREQRSAEDLHRLLDACLALRDVGASSDFAEEAARRVGAALVSSCLGWTERQDRPNVAVSWEALRADPSLWRLEVCVRLRRIPTTLPPPLLSDLVEALAELNEGHGEPPDLLAPLSVKGRGKNPRERREVEELLWQCIEAQAVRGMPREAAKKMVADAAGVSIKAVEKWREEWQRRAGHDAVADSLQLVARAVREGNLSELVAPDFVHDMVQLWRSAGTPEKARKHRA
jgi:hypothetical protein